MHELDTGAPAACTDKRRCSSQLQLPAKSQASSSPISLGSSARCDHHSLLCSFCPVSRTPTWTGAVLVAPSWATGECRQLSLQTVQLMFQGILTSSTKKVSSHLCSCSNLVHRETAFWSRLGFLLGLHQCSGFFHLVMQSERQRKTALFNQS